MRLAKNWAVFISGTGSNLAALSELPFFARISLVVSSKKSAFGLTRAHRAGISTLILDKKPDWETLSLHLERMGIERIFLAGFMKVIPESFLKGWTGKILNIHPSLLPKYPGLNSIERAFEANDELGVTIHEVIPEVDAGKKLAQSRVGKVGSLSWGELLTHIHEQRLSRRVIEKWQKI